MALRVFEWPTQVGFTKQVDFITRENEFEGYTQIISQGINNKRRTWNLTFIGDSDEAPFIQKFIEDHKGSIPFLWSPPNGQGQIQVVAKYSYSSNSLGLDVENISVNFTEWLSPERSS